MSFICFHVLENNKSHLCLILFIGPAPLGRGVDDRKRGAKAKVKKVGDADDSRGPKRPSLRIGTGKKGRSAQENMRRGSLKKRNRSADKAQKEEAALERKTVNLPEGPLLVTQLAEVIDEKPVAVIKFLMTDLGVFASMTQSLDPNTCKAVAEGFGKIVGGAEEEDDDDDK
jgi:Translation initiation factor IF-2, N-terminal region